MQLMLCTLLTHFSAFWFHNILQELQKLGLVALDVLTLSRSESIFGYLCDFSCDFSWFKMPFLGGQGLATNSGENPCRRNASNAALMSALGMLPYGIMVIFCGCGIP